MNFIGVKVIYLRAYWLHFAFCQMRQIMLSVGLIFETSCALRFSFHSLNYWDKK